MSETIEPVEKGIGDDNVPARIIGQTPQFSKKIVKQKRFGQN